MTQRKRASQRKIADALFSKYIRARDRGCLVCGTGEQLQCAHVISRSYLGVRFDPENAVALCQSHHVYYTHRPLEWEDWVVDRMGRDAYTELRRRAQAGGRPDYPTLIADLKERLEEVAA